ncbi:MAG: hypothetical protein ABI193_23025 [Minicystis sp.]
MSARFVRQILLPEIGEAGQARLAHGSATVGGASLAHEVASLYARGAGFAEVVPGAIDVDALAPVTIVSTPEARSLLAGARAALAEIRRAARVGAIERRS